MTANISAKYKTIDFNKWTNYFFIAFAFSIPISKALQSLFTALIIISWLLEGNLSSKIQIIKKDRLSLILLFLIAFSTFSLLWSPDIIFAIDFIFRKYWHYLIIPIMLTSFNFNNIKYVFNAFLLSMLISEIVSYGIFFEIWTYDNVPSSDPSPFMNHTDYSTFLGFALIIILLKLSTIKETLWRVLYSLYFTTGLINLFINGGRTGQVTFIVTMLVLSMVYFRHSYKIIVGLILSIMLTLTLAYNFSPNFHDRINQLNTDVTNMYTNHDFSGSLSTRFALWITGSSIFIDNPILGTGIGGEVTDIAQYSKQNDFRDLTGFTDYHNSFVQYAVQLGIVGLLIPISVFYTLFTLKFKNEDYKLLTIAFTTIYFLHSMGGFSFHIMNSLVFLCTFAALFNSISYLENKT